MYCIYRSFGVTLCVLRPLKMISVNVNQAVKDLRSSFKGLSKQKIEKATVDALNRTARLGRTVARSEVKKVYNIPQRYLNQVNYIPAKAVKLKAFIYASSKPIPMDAFSPKFEFIPSAGSASIVSVTKRGVQKLRAVKRLKQQQGVSIEIKKGERTIVPYAFLIPGAKPRVFARGSYKQGEGSYGFIQRHTREENSNGNDRVTPLASVTIFSAVINKKVEKQIERKISSAFSDNMLRALKRQAGIL
jgi:hypothetical protein